MGSMQRLGGDAAVLFFSLLLTIICARLLGYKCSSSKSRVHTSDYWAAFFFILLTDFFVVVANECYYVFVVYR